MLHRDNSLYWYTNIHIYIYIQGRIDAYAQILSWRGKIFSSLKCLDRLSVGDAPATHSIYSRMRIQHTYTHIFAHAHVYVHRCWHAFVCMIYVWTLVFRCIWKYRHMTCFHLWRGGFLKPSIACNAWQISQALDIICDKSWALLDAHPTFSLENNTLVISGPHSGYPVVTPLPLPKIPVPVNLHQWDPKFRRCGSGRVERSPGCHYEHGWLVIFCGYCCRSYDLPLWLKFQRIHDFCLSYIRYNFCSSPPHWSLLLD